MLPIKTIAAITGLFALPAIVTSFAAGQSERAENGTLSMQGVERIEVKVPFGDISVETGGSRIEFHVKRWIEKKDSSEGRRWMTESKLEASVKGGVATLEELPFGKRNAREHNGGTNFHPHYKLTVTVPADQFGRVHLGAGDLQVTGAFRTLDARLGAGNITANRLDVSRKLSFNVGAGEIRTELQRGLAEPSDLRVGAGDLHLTLPTTVDADVDASVGMGEIAGIPSAKSEKRRGPGSMGSHRKATFGQGGAGLSLHVGVGSIELRGPVPTRSVASSDGDQREESAWDSGEPMSEFSAVKEDHDVIHQRHGGDDGGDWASDLDRLAPEVDRAVEIAIRESDRARSQALREADAEIKRAIRQLDQALAEARVNGSKGAKRHRGADAHGLDLDIDKIVREALEQARAATKVSLDEALKGQREDD